MDNIGLKDSLARFDLFTTRLTNLTLDFFFCFRTAAPRTDLVGSLVSEATTRALDQVVCVQFDSSSRHHSQHYSLTVPILVEEQSARRTVEPGVISVVRCADQTER